MIFINIFNNTLRADVKNCISLMPLIAKPSNKLAQGDGSRSEHIKQKKNITNTLCGITITGWLHHKLEEGNRKETSIPRGGAEKHHSPRPLGAYRSPTTGGGTTERKSHSPRSRTRYLPKTETEIRQQRMSPILAPLTHLHHWGQQTMRNK